MSNEIKQKTKNPSSLKHISTTFVLSYLLGFTGRSAQAVSEGKLVPSGLSSVEPPDEPYCPVNSFFDPKLQSPLHITPVVDNEYISQLVVGSKKESKHIANNVQELRSIDPYIATYIDLVFTHLQGFRFNTYLSNEVPPGVTRAAMYLPGSKAIVMLPRSTEEHSDWLQIIGHELRHVAWNTVHRTLGNSNSVSSKPYFPDTPAQKERVKKMIADGDKRVHQLKAQLALERTKKISPEEAERLKKLREASRDDYHRYYKASHPGMLFDEGTIKSIESVIGKKLIPGTQFDIGSFYPQLDFGLLTVKNISKSKTHPGLISIAVELEDPLYAAVYRILQHHDEVTSKYREDEYLQERDAYLHGHCSPSIIKYLFGDLEKFSQEIMQQAISTAVPYTQWLPHYSSITEHESAGVIATLLDTASFDISQAKDYFQFVEHAIAIGNMAAAKTGLKTLIKNGHPQANVKLAEIYSREGNYAASSQYLIAHAKYVASMGQVETAKQTLNNLLNVLAQNNLPTGKVNLELARIYYSEKNYPSAVRYFEIAQLKNTKLTSKDRSHFNDALKFEQARKKSAAKKIGISQEELESAREFRSNRR